MLKTLRKRIASRIKRAPVVSVLPLSGTIGTVGFGRGLTDAGLAAQIDRAFAPSRLSAVALSINSPGGSPTQSALIAARIRRLAAEKNVPVIAFCEDVAASGGYWLATAGDEIYADDNSIIGSIGVIYAGFGFQTLLERQGVERRVHTAGRSKSMLDPFRPEKEEDVARIKALQGVIHENFIEQVRTRRGAKLNPADDLFTGDVWVGRQAVDVGLIDGIGHLVPMMKQRFGDDVRFNTVAQRRGLLQRLRGQASVGRTLEGLNVEDMTSRMVMGAAQAVEERALWSRFGL